MKREVTVITDSLSAMSPELASQYEVLVIPYHLIFDGKSYLDDTIDRDKLFARLESFRNLPTHSACTTGEIVNAFKQAAENTNSILFVSMSSAMSADYNAALKAREIMGREMPDIAIEVVDSRSVISGELLVVLAAARAAKEGKDLAEVTGVARKIMEKVTYINVPETLFFFERAGRSGGEPSIARAPVPIFPLLEMDYSSGGAGKFIAKNRTKAKAIGVLLDLVEQRCGDRKIQAAIGYSNNPEEAETLKEKLTSRFSVEGLHVTPCSLVACVVTGPRCVVLGFYPED